MTKYGLCMSLYVTASVINFKPYDWSTQPRMFRKRWAICEELMLTVNRFWGIVIEARQALLRVQLYRDATQVLKHSLFTTNICKYSQAVLQSGPSNVCVHLIEAKCDYSYQQHACSHIILRLQTGCYLYIRKHGCIQIFTYLPSWNRTQSSRL